MEGALDSVHQALGDAGKRPDQVDKSAPWRGVAICERCGADSTALMRTALRARELCETARQALFERGRASDAVALAQAACRLHVIPRGQPLLALAFLASGQTAEAYTVIEQVLK